MNMRTSTRVLLLVMLGTAGCNRDTEVRQEVKELEEARQESPGVAQDLRKEIQDKKAEVAQLEEKLALAERGVTDEVLEERRDLKEAVREQENEVRREVNEAQGAAQVHTAESERARVALEATKTPGRVQTEVHSGHTVVPGSTEVEVQRQQEQVPIDTTRTVEREAPQQAPQP